MTPVSNPPRINPDEILFEQIRASGPGGQHVNKVSTAVHCRFEITASTLPSDIKQRLLETNDKRISAEGVVIIKAQRFRSLDKNRQDAIDRLQDLVNKAAKKPARRIPTKPARAARKKRMDDKTRRGQTKNLRSRRGVDIDG
jgi:ribosome-associated protein